MENVFCLARKDIEGVLGTRLPQGFSQEPGLSEALALPHYFIPRSQAEGDPDFKQVIPYQLFCCDDRFFVFRRGGGGGEKRLAGRLSIGVGGHVNDNDANGTRLSPADFLCAMERERKEELICPDVLSSFFKGWINDDSDPVGQVHLGAVYVCHIPDRHDVSIRPHGEDLESVGWLTAAEILERKNEFEKWSVLSLDFQIQ